MGKRKLRYPNKQTKMKKIDTDTLLKYAFQDLSSKREVEVESYLDDNPTDAAIVDGILNFALKNDLTTKKEYEKAIEKNRLETISKFKERVEADTTLGNQKGRKIVRIIIGVILLFALGFSAYYLLNTNEVDTVIEKEYAQNKSNLLPNVPLIDTEKALNEFVSQSSETTMAGAEDNGWKTDLRKGNLLNARQQLREFIKDTPPDNYIKHTDKLYYLGVLELLLDGGNYAKALEYLEIARGTRQARNFSPYVLAYLANGNFEKAKIEYDSKLAIQSFYSEGLKKSLSR